MDEFVKAYTLGWYHSAQMSGKYLWDIPWESYDGEDKEIIKKTAIFQYKRLKNIPVEKSDIKGL